MRSFNMNDGLTWFKLCLIGLVAWLGSAGKTPATAADEPRRWALLIGVNEYASLRPLQQCVADIQSLRDQLVDCGFQAEQVYMLRDKSEKFVQLINVRRCGSSRRR
jgi:hypothetical protein